ncbi:hypothetical protein BDZ97DRAFT_1814044 [Flammula alnicola]|nr:hypothetical protein BDZ97DRAFT_1814044 [Flammula alnicola]
MPKDLVVKDVEAVLMKTRKCRRRPGDIPYPISYSNQMADLFVCFDIWNHMFLTNHFGNLTVTMHRFEQPPARSLDIGCGSGFWVIEAAKKWQNSKIIGFDIVKIQPRLHDIEHLIPLSQRIGWVHGNFLDGLPFPSNHFDCVRMAGLGLAIPEDEWQFVLEEIHRVMTPGAVLEIIEENLLFPCPSTLLQQPDQEASRSSPAVYIYIPPPHIPSLKLLKSKSTNFYVRSSGSPERSPISPATSIHEHSKFASRISLFRPSVYVSGPSSSSTLAQPSPATTETTTGTEHPQDHTRLNIAWEAMLATCFLSPKLLSVIPFYLTSSSFADTKSHSPLIIPLHPNSGAKPIPTLKLYRSMGSMREKENQRTVADPLHEFDFAPAVSTRSIKPDGCSFRTSILPRPQAPAWGTMHLARTVSTIKGCKEAIWAEYKQLYDKDALYLLSRTASGDGEDYSSQPHKYVVRKAFEVDWNNWEYDMLDRIAMRNNLLTHVSWVQATSKAERPDCQTWREKLNRKSGSEASSGHLVTGYNPDDLCRSLRVFTGFKS